MLHSFFRVHNFLVPSGIVLSVMLIFFLFARFDYSDDFKKRHPILTGSGFGFVWEWILLPLIHKVVFLFTPSIYRFFVIEELKGKVEQKFKSRIKDLEYQVGLLEGEHKQLRNTEHEYTGSKEVAYWDGVKYGFALKSKQEHRPETQLKTLTTSHLFTLQEIALGNKTINGLVAAYLEEHGYCKLVWDDEANNKYHYKLTTKGEKRLKRKQKNG